LLHQEVLLDVENVAWFGVGDLTKVNIVAYGEIGKAGWLQTGSGNRVIEVGYFWSNIGPPESSLDVENVAWFSVGDLSKFSIVAYGEISKAGWLQTGSGNLAVDGGYFWPNFAPHGSSFRCRKCRLVWRGRFHEI
jgi:hypothetical protein